MFNFLKRNKSQESKDVKENLILKKDNIKLGLNSVGKMEAIQMAGELLVQSGYVNTEYIQAMKEREKVVTTYIGAGVAIPHGVGESKKNIEKSGIVVLQFPNGVDFGDEKAYLIIGIAGVGDEHISILSNIATVLEDDEITKELYTTTSTEKIYDLFSDAV